MASTSARWVSSRATRAAADRARLQLGRRVDGRGRVRARTAHPQPLELGDGVGVMLDRAAAHRLATQVGDQDGAGGWSSSCGLGEDTPAGVEAGLRPAVELVEVRAEASPRIRVIGSTVRISTAAVSEAVGPCASRRGARPVGRDRAERASRRRAHRCACRAARARRCRPGVSPATRIRRSDGLGDTPHQLPLEYAQQRLAWPESSPSRERSERTSQPSVPISQSIRASPKGRSRARNRVVERAHPLGHRAVELPDLVGSRVRHSLILVRDRGEGLRRSSAARG